MFQTKRPPLLVLLAGLAPLAAGCATSAPRQPPGVPPTPATITKENPGGDADDPGEAALLRLAELPWGHRKDYWGTLKVPLVDWKNWRRVRIFGHPTRATYRYGDDHHALATVWYKKVEGPDDPESCLARFVDEAMPAAKTYSVAFGPIVTQRGVQKVRGEEKPIAFHVLDGSVESLLASDDYVGGVAAYQSWPGTCLVHGFAVVATEHRELAIRVRDRWVSEGAARLVWTKKVQEAPEPKTR